MLRSRFRLLGVRLRISVRILQFGSSQGLCQGWVPASRVRGWGALLEKLRRRAQEVPWGPGHGAGAECEVDLLDLPCSKPKPGMQLGRGDKACTLLQQIRGALFWSPYGGDGDQRLLRGILPGKARFNHGHQH